MKILILAPGADTGGQGIALKQLFDTLGGAEVRSVTATQNYINYQTDLIWPRHRKEIALFAHEADVLHLRNNPKALREFGDWRRPERPAVLHQHGSHFRANPLPHRVWANKNKAPILVSTIDLLTIEDSAHWFPAPIDIAFMQTLRKPNVNRRIVIAHAPTARRMKGTPEFLDAVESLRIKGYEFEVDLIENVSWDECQKRKAKADIFFDQLMFGYGNNGLEAMAMGIPVLTGATQPEVTAKMRKILGELPYHDAADGLLADRLEELIVSSKLRREVASRGVRYIARWHSPEVIAERALALWQEALNRWASRVTA